MLWHIDFFYGLVCVLICVVLRLVSFLHLSVSLGSLMSTEGGCIYLSCSVSFVCGMYFMHYLVVSDSAVIFRCCYYCSFCRLCRSN